MAKIRKKINNDLYEAATNLNSIHNMYAKQKIGRHTSNKYQFLTSTTKRLSKFMLNEAQRQEPKIYRKFKRGALIFVEFGVNIGQEMSNRHWAIVLNKEDSVRKGTLTVVPISSKSGWQSVKIDGLIATSATLFIREYSRSNSIKMFLVMESLKNDPQYIYRNDDRFIDLYNKYHEMFADKISDMEQPIIDEAFIADLSIQIDKSLDLAIHYDRFRKVSFAKCSDITTISKDRIIFKNNLDPCGKIVVSQESLDRIDKKIADLYIY